MGVNRVTLTGEVTLREPLRHTPAGLPLLRLRLAHDSMQMEAGGQRKLHCEAEAVAIGEMAARMDSLTPGTAVTVEGFLGNKGRTGTLLILHITNFEIKA